MTAGRRIWALALTVVALGVAPATAAAVVRPLDPVSGGGSSGFNDAQGVAVSPDNEHVYATSNNDGKLRAFSRNLTTGALTPLDGTAGCLSKPPAPAGCTEIKGLTGARSVVVSPNGEHVYVAGDALVAFDRDDTTGALTQLPNPDDCISNDGRSDNDDPATAGDCVDGKFIGSSGMAISADGANVYVTGPDAVAMLVRNTTTGALTQPTDATACMSETGNGGACGNGKMLDGTIELTIAPDGKTVYAVSLFNDGIAILPRNTSTGVLSQPTDTTACWSDTGVGEPEDPAGSAGQCTDGRVLNALRMVAVSPDNKNVYVASEQSDGVAVFDRNTTTGLLTQKTGTAGCTTETGRSDPDTPGSAGECVDGTGLVFNLSVIVSPDGKNVYVGAGAIAAFYRNTSTGVLTQMPGEAAQSAGGGGGFGLAVTLDNGSLYGTGAFDLFAYRRLPDEDFDGAAEPGDNCPGLVNVDQLDTDSDGAGNACDNNDDGDSRVDGADNCPLHPNSDQANRDGSLAGGDGLGDACDDDDDADGDLDTADNCQTDPNPDQLNTDGDTRGDVCDGDDDNDGRLDQQDNCQVVPNNDQANTDGAPDGGNACDPDDDNDGDLDENDNCAQLANGAQEDLDGDDQGDACDLDDDNDGPGDTQDNCPRDANPDQRNTDGAGDGGDVCDPDDDDDGSADVTDNCGLLPNSEQENLDGDLLGDPCDPDDDNDGQGDGDDNCPRDENTDQRNTDGSSDGGDVCDEDDDDDGVADAVEVAADSSRFDLDSDDDGIPDGAEVGTSPIDRDSDNDKVQDGTEIGVTRGVPDPPGPVRGTNLEEFEKDLNPKTKTKPNEADTDRDGLKDGTEDKNRDGARQRKRETDPLKKDTDGDGRNDKKDRFPLNRRRR